MKELNIRLTGFTNDVYKVAVFIARYFCRLRVTVYIWPFITNAHAWLQDYAESTIDPLL